MLKHHMSAVALTVMTLAQAAPAFAHGGGGGFHGGGGGFHGGGGGFGGFRGGGFGGFRGGGFAPGFGGGGFGGFRGGGFAPGFGGGGFAPGFGGGGFAPGFGGAGFSGFRGGGFNPGFSGANFGGFHTGDEFGGYGGSFGVPAFNRTPSFSMPGTTPTIPRSFPNYGARNLAPGAPINNVNRGNTLSNMNRGNNENNVNRGNTLSNMNRGHSNSNLNRGITRNNVDRGNTINRMNRENTFENVNRMGDGWHDSYLGYHQGWVHGYWNGHDPGGFGWRTDGFGFGGLGYGLGWHRNWWGICPWLYGPMLYGCGYWDYVNPYYDVGFAPFDGFDFAQPIDAQAVAPEEDVATQAVATFDRARDAFKTADFTTALDLAGQAIKVMPNDGTMHEFRALTLFALKRYDEAATELYAVLSAGPGWDWTTMIGLYSDPDVYTTQLRALEAYCKQNRDSAPAHFVLAYQYLTAEHPEAALRQLKIVTALQPKDTVSAQLIAQLDEAPKLAAGDVPSERTDKFVPPGLAPPGGAAPSGKQGTLAGASWSAEPVPGTRITALFKAENRFSWKVEKGGKTHEFDGRFTFEDGILTLVQNQNNNTMVGDVTWQDDHHFNFKVTNSPPGDRGLSFAKPS